MKIVNKTSWRTSDLKRIVMRICDDELEKGQHKRVRVMFVAARQQRCVPGLCWGRIRKSLLSSEPGWIGSARIQINVPTKYDSLPDHILVAMCSTIAHELAHARGIEGTNSNEIWMRRSVRYGRPKTEAERDQQQTLYGWVLDDRYRPVKKADAVRTVLAPEERSSRRAEQAAQRVEKRARKAAEGLARWERAIKRAQRHAAKYRKQVAYYRRREIQANQPANPPETAATPPR